MKGGTNDAAAKPVALDSNGRIQCVNFQNLQHVQMSHEKVR